MTTNAWHDAKVELPQTTNLIDVIYANGQNKSSIPPAQANLQLAKFWRYSEAVESKQQIAVLVLVNFDTTEVDVTQFDNSEDTDINVIDSAYAMLLAAQSANPTQVGAIIASQTALDAYTGPVNLDRIKTFGQTVVAKRETGREIDPDFDDPDLYYQPAKKQFIEPTVVLGNQTVPSRRRRGEGDTPETSIRNR